MITQYDTNGDGQLSYEQAKPMFVGFFTGMNKKMPEKYEATLCFDDDFIQETMAGIDKSQTGKLSPNEIEAFVRKLIN